MSPERVRDTQIFGIAALHTQAGNQVLEDADGQGLLILTPSLRVVYRDHHARNLCNLINKLEHDKTANGIIPAKVFEACLEIATVLQSGYSRLNGDSLQIKVVLGNAHTQVVVLVTGLPLFHDPSQSQILVILEEASYGLRRLIRTAQKHFRLSEKETRVVQHLLKGWTNKEIANELHISEQTIKEHIKNIMKKAKAVTRTGIIIAISGLTSQSHVDDGEKSSSLNVCNVRPGSIQLIA